VSLQRALVEPVSSLIVDEAFFRFLLFLDHVDLTFVSTRRVEWMEFGADNLLNDCFISLFTFD